MKTATIEKMLQPGQQIWGSPKQNPSSEEHPPAVTATGLSALSPQGEEGKLGSPSLWATAKQQIEGVSCPRTERDRLGSVFRGEVAKFQSGLTSAGQLRTL